MLVYHILVSDKAFHLITIAYGKETNFSNLALSPHLSVQKTVGHPEVITKRFVNLQR